MIPFEGYVVSAPLYKVVIFELHGLRFVAYKKKAAKKASRLLNEALNRSCIELVNVRDVIKGLRAIKNLQEERK